jgi:hypothetical protein
VRGETQGQESRSHRTSADPEAHELLYRFLNRGNHEDAGICCVFGFMKECLANYDEVTFR